MKSNQDSDESQVAYTTVSNSDSHNLTLMRRFLQLVHPSRDFRCVRRALMGFALERSISIGRAKRRDERRSYSFYAAATQHKTLRLDSMWNLGA